MRATWKEDTRQLTSDRHQIEPELVRMFVLESKEGSVPDVASGETKVSVFNNLVELLYDEDFTAHYGLSQPYGCP